VQEGNGNAAASLPKGFPVILMHDLADCCQVGEAVEVTGTLPLQLQGNVASGAPSSQCHYNLL
jgi:DNA replicative helicase MCM subunit Mcm2 (Cdc46/Mcm family)